MSVKNYSTTIYNWLNGFAPTFRSPISEGLFDESHPQPNDYIEYASSTGNFASSFIQAIIIYSKSTAYTQVMNIADAIESAIGEKGIVLREEWGYVKIEKGNPFYQDKTDEDSNYRAGYINLLVTIYQKNV